MTVSWNMTYIFELKHGLREIKLQPQRYLCMSVGSASSPSNSYCINSAHTSLLLASHSPIDPPSFAIQLVLFVHTTTTLKTKSKKKAATLEFSGVISSSALIPTHHNASTKTDICNKSKSHNRCHRRTSHITLITFCRHRARAPMSQDKSISRPIQWSPQQ